MKVIKCESCGKDFESEWSRFCSVPCAEKAYQESCIRESWDACRIDDLEKYKTTPEFFRKQNPEAWAWADEWHRECNVYAWGSEGIGKTSLCKYLLAKDVDRLKIVEAPEMVYIQAISKRYDAEDRLIPYLRCDTLLLDDIHDVCLKQDGYSVLRMIINDRHEHRQRTLVTANKSPNDMANHIDGICGGGFGLQMLRRLAPVKELAMIGKSYRQYMQEGM